jgi:hypothetical protein
MKPTTPEVINFLEEIQSHLYNLGGKKENPACDAIQETVDILKDLQTIVQFGFQEDEIEIKLKDCVKLITNNKTCVVLEVIKGREQDLTNLGYFDPKDHQFRLTKGENQTCTVFKKDGSSFSWYWGYQGYTLVSDSTSKKGKLIQECIEKDFGISITLRR